MNNSEVISSLIMMEIPEDIGIHTFNLKDGKRYEGFILSCWHNIITFFDRGIYTQAEPFFFNADDVDIETLKVYDQIKMCWKKFSPFE